MFKNLKIKKKNLVILLKPTLLLLRLNIIINNIFICFNFLKINFLKNHILLNFKCLIDLNFFKKIKTINKKKNKKKCLKFQKFYFLKMEIY